MKIIVTPNTSGMDPENAARVRLAKLSELLSGPSAVAGGTLGAIFAAYGAGRSYDEAARTLAADISLLL